MANIQPRPPPNIAILYDDTGKSGERDSAEGQPTTDIRRLHEAIKPRSAHPVTRTDLGAGFTIRDRPAAQTDPSTAQANSAAPTGPSPGQAGHTPLQTGRASVQVPRAPAQAGPAPDHPSPAQAYPPAAQAGSAVPANHTSFQGSFAPAQVHPSPVQAYAAAKVGPAVLAASARPRPSWAGAGAGARAPPTRADLGYAQAGPGPIQAYPSVAQVGPGVPTSRAPAQALPAAQTRAAPVQPNRPRQKKGVMQKIMSFFCCDSSGQMIG